jgi:hypothetical protein
MVLYVVALRLRVGIGRVLMMSSVQRVIVGLSQWHAFLDAHIGEILS